MQNRFQAFSRMKARFTRCIHAAFRGAITAGRGYATEFAAPGRWATWLATSTRERAPSLARIRDTCTCTVYRDKNNRAPISGFDNPSPTRYATFTSVGVNAAHP